MKKINLPIKQTELEGLKAGDLVLLSAVIYTARDQAHKRLVDTLKSGRKLPFDLKGKIIYYCGPTKTPKGKTFGSCGPTTSSRMDRFTPPLLNAGLKGMIGKGNRSREVAQAIKKHKAVYFLTYSGCGALLSQFIIKANAIAFTDLGPEAIYKLEVKDFPLIVGIDARGKSAYV